LRGAAFRNDQFALYGLIYPDKSQDPQEIPYRRPRRQLQDGVYRNRMVHHVTRLDFQLLEKSSDKASQVVLGGPGGGI
jgi:hypothetical protein